jgi:hypothetical protein
MGSVWEWMGVDGSGWEWMGVDGSRWESMGVDGSGWEWMGVDGKWMGSKEDRCLTSSGLAPWVVLDVYFMVKSLR